MAYDSIAANVSTEKKECAGGNHGACVAYRHGVDQCKELTARSSGSAFALMPSNTESRICHQLAEEGLISLE
jgi:hypothetical protein